MLRLRGRRAQSSIEVGVLIIFAAMGIAFMVIYGQRALQGQVFNSAQSVGMDFDVEDTFAEDNAMNLSETSWQAVLTSMIEAQFIQQKEGPAGGAYYDPNWLYASTPTGPQPREPSLRAPPNIVVNWSTSGGGGYEANR